MPSESDLALRLAFIRWGRGYDGRPRCPVCPDRTLWRRRDRVRVFGCSGCEREHSVTSGTFMHGAKLSLIQIARYVEAHRSEVPPSARALSKAFRQRRETAWAWSMRVKSAIGALRPNLYGMPFAMFSWYRLRPPHRHSPDPHPHASTAARDACASRHAAAVAFVSDALETAAFVRASSPMGAARELRTSMVWEVDEEANGRLHDLATVLLKHVHRTVSERWLARYLAFAAHAPADPWVALAQRAPPAFRRIRPAGSPAAALDHRFAPRLQTSPPIDEVCRSLRRNVAVPDALKAVHAGLRPSHHPTPHDSDRPTCRGVP
jgi:hypothetical protein